MRKRKGFTMVELMVVVIIMAILGLAVMPALMGSSEKAKYSRAWSDLDAIANAFTAYYGKEGNLPTLNGTAALDDKIYEDTERPLLQSFLGTQLEDLCDPWNQKYQIKSTWNAATGKGHIIVYVKPEGTEGTAGKDPGFAGITGITARVDPYSDSDSTLGGLPMAKLIINVI